MSPSSELELLAFTAKKLEGHVTLATPSFRKNLSGYVWTVLETCMPNLKAVALTVLELLAFNAQKFRESRDPGHGPFRKILRDHIRTVPGNMYAKVEVCSFNRFEAISI